MQSDSIAFSSHTKQETHNYAHLTQLLSQVFVDFTEQTSSATTPVHNSEDSQSGISTGIMDLHCPVCLHVAMFPVKTNCGHLFCAPCLILYWKHSCCLEAISCPLCRQKVNVMINLFSESRSDKKHREVLSHVRNYNKRYSGEPRRISDYLFDAPFFLLLLFRTLGNIGGLVWLFLLRVALCGFGAAASLVSSLETMPGHFSGALGLLDDLVVVFLLLIAIINIHQQMGPERTSRPHTVEQGILSDVL
ncbi:LOW QUALITY PROTEIN: RING-HC_RNF170 domain-containing protein [Clarias gariepinus]|uniref:LOW QUALITY PROTEIN: RING-HC_RNF170 domain-containing protein n=1 Tax=Clarias gariepinus TaxID=13013 RepID=UPI00234D33AB|nr:LOW QUALITY PROTEIN: RING-HC_RNF170 domain-containing protein [Clarias gariepinus]